MNQRERNKKHRDIQCCNNANAAVKGCLYSAINKICIESVIELSEKKDINDIYKTRKVAKLLDLATTSNDEA